MVRSLKFRTGKSFFVELDIWFFPVFIVTCFTGIFVDYALAWFSIFLHELAHVAAAVLTGHRISVLRILPVGFNAVISDEEAGCIQKVGIYISGPAMNIVLMGLARFINTYYSLNPDNMRFFISVNLYLCVFNLLPILPMDGGKILLEWFAFTRGANKADRILYRVSFFLALSIMAIGILLMVENHKNWGLAIVGVYLLFIVKSGERLKNFMSMKHAIYRRSRLLKKGVYPVRDLVMVQSMQLSESLKYMDFDRFHFIHVLDQNLKLVQTLSEQEIIDGLVKYRSDMTFEEFIKQNSKPEE